ncbi:MAG: polysaccharide deacetylase family protein [Bacteroidota bacterium]
MKTKLRDVLIWFFFYSGLVFLYRQWKRRQGPLVRVVCLHDVPDREWFESFMQLLTTRYHLLSPQQFEEGSFHAEKINILLTFDDGYQSWVDVVLPTLDSYKVRAIFFINSGLLDVHESPVDQAAYVSERVSLGESSNRSDTYAA